MGAIKRIIDRAGQWIGFGLDEGEKPQLAKEKSWLSSIDWFKASVGASLVSIIIRWLDIQFYSLAGSPEFWLWHYLPVTFTAGCIHLLVQLDKLEVSDRIKKWFIPTALGLGSMLLYKESLNLLIYFVFPN